MTLNVAVKGRQEETSTHGTEVDNGAERFRYLWELSRKGGMQNIPLKAATVRGLLEWMVMNMDGKLIAKLGLTGIGSMSRDELVGKVEVDQRRRTVVRKQKQQQRANKKKVKKAT